MPPWFLKGQIYVVLRSSEIQLGIIKFKKVSIFELRFMTSLTVKQFLFMYFCENASDFMATFSMECWV